MKWETSPSPSPKSHSRTPTLRKYLPFQTLSILIRSYYSWLLSIWSQHLKRNTNQYGTALLVSCNYNNEYNWFMTYDADIWDINDIIQCIGRHFGAFVTHETGRYIYFYVGQKGFLLWSTVIKIYYLIMKSINNPIFSSLIEKGK